MSDGQMLTCDLKAVQSYRSWVQERFGDRGQGSSLEDLPAVSYGTTEHHTEDHPNYHDSGDADAHVPDDV